MQPVFYTARLRVILQSAIHAIRKCSRPERSLAESAPAERRRAVPRERRAENRGLRRDLPTSAAIQLVRSHVPKQGTTS